MKNKQVINSINVIFLVLSAFSALLILLIEPINGVIVESGLPFGIKAWNFIQTIVIVGNILGILLVAYFIAYKNEVVKYITIESTQDAVHESIQNLVNQEEQLSIEGEEKFKQEIDQLLQKEKDKSVRNEKLLSTLCAKYEFSQAVTYTKVDTQLRLNVHYAFVITEQTNNSVEIGEGIAGQVAKTGEFIYLKEVPQGYMKVLSGLGEMSPTNLIIVPLVTQEGTIALAELAGFKEYNDKEIKEIVKGTKLVLEAVIN